MDIQIIQVPDIPYTLNGKRVEVLVKKVRAHCKMSIFCKCYLHLGQIVNGAPVSSVNPATLSNPECLLFYASLGEELRREVS